MSSSLHGVPTARAEASVGAAPDIFRELGVAPVINACGIYTDLGGSRLSPRVWKAMAEMNRHFVSMVDLLETSGRLLARQVEAEAARVTPGAAASIAMGIAACLARQDGDKMERLPDTTGMHHAVAIQRNHRYKYDRQAWMTGATPREVGSERGTTRGEMEAALTPDVAAVLHPAHLDALHGTVSLDDVVAIAHRRGIPVFVDAAYLCYPLELLRRYAHSGADLVCYSSKYFGGPNAGGFICGRAEFVSAVAALDFTRYESGLYRTFGRPFKLDRQTVVGVVVALQEWIELDHQRRWEGYAAKVAHLRERWASQRGLTVTPMSFTMDERLVPEPVNCLVMEFDGASGHTARDIATALADGSPSIHAVVEGEKLVFVMDTIADGEELIIAERLEGLLS